VFKIGRSCLFGAPPRRKQERNIQMLELLGMIFGEQTSTTRTKQLTEKQKAEKMVREYLLGLSMVVKAIETDADRVLNKKEKTK